MSDKQRSGRTGFNELTVRNRADRNSHELAIGREVEQFLSVAPPLHIRAAIHGDLPLAANHTLTRKWLDVNLMFTGLIRRVRDPLPVGRELSPRFVVVCLNDRKRLSIPIQWQTPKVIARPLFLRVDKESAI